jgi:hypothetical protein
MSKLPCKNVNVMNSICANTGKYCIGCNNYEEREIVSETEYLKDMKPFSGKEIKEPLVEKYKGKN